MEINFKLKAGPVIHCDLCYRLLWTVFLCGLSLSKPPSRIKSRQVPYRQTTRSRALSYVFPRRVLFPPDQFTVFTTSATDRLKTMTTGIEISGENATVVPPQGSNPPPDLSAPLIKFPPFPEIPEGVSIIPFSQFPLKGIKKRVVPDPDHPDLDGHGRPTVRLKVAHASTSSDKWKKKKRRLGEGDDGVVRRYVWYEEWAKDEDSRKTSVEQ